MPLLQLCRGAGGGGSGCGGRGVSWWQQHAIHQGGRGTMAGVQHDNACYSAKGSAWHWERSGHGGERSATTTALCHPPGGGRRRGGGAAQHCNNALLLMPWLLGGRLPEQGWQDDWGRCGGGWGGRRGRVGQQQPPHLCPPPDQVLRGGHHPLAPTRAMAVPEEGNGCCCGVELLFYATNNI